MSEAFEPSACLALAGVLSESTGVITGDPEKLSLCLSIKCETKEGFIGMIHLLEMFKKMNIDTNEDETT